MSKKYIDAETIRSRMMYYGFRAPDMTVTEFVDSLPTADVRENVYGEFIELAPCKYRCGGCGKIIYADHQSEKNFCPNCGSDNRRERRTE